MFINIPQPGKTDNCQLQILIKDVAFWCEMPYDMKKLTVARIIQKLQRKPPRVYAIHRLPQGNKNDSWWLTVSKELI